MSWLMNRVFQGTSHYYRSWWTYYLDRMLSAPSAQRLMVQELHKRE